MKVDLTRRLSAGHVQAEVYHQLRVAGIESRIEHLAVGQDGRQSRFDILVLHGDEGVAVIECKSYVRPWSRKFKTKQALKYESHGLPVLLVRTINDVDAALCEIHSLLGVLEGGKLLAEAR